MKWLNDYRIELGDKSVSYGALLTGIFVLVVGFFVAAKVAKRIRSLNAHSPVGERWRNLASQAVGYGLRFLSVAVALQVSGVDVAGLLAAGAVAAVGIGIAMQKVAENFVSGIILSAERSIREGDIIEFEGRIARVQHVGIRATICLTLDHEEIIVPNSILAQTAVKNLTLTDGIYRLRVTVSVAYATDLDRAFEVLSAAAEGLEWREQERAPVVLLTNFGSSSIDFEVSVWTTDVWGMRRGQSALRHALWRALRDASITIPFPQMDVHFDALNARSPQC